MNNIKSLAVLNQIYHVHVHNRIASQVFKQINDQVRYQFVESISIYMWRYIEEQVKFQVRNKIGESCAEYRNTGSI
jgi:hypothetical protein